MNGKTFPPLLSNKRTAMQRHPDFPLENGLIYLNHAAVSPWPKRTARAVTEFADENVTHGARFYPQWLAKERELRRQLQTLLNAPSVDDIALVKNTSEALSFVAYGLPWKEGDNIVSSAEEFPSNRIPWQSLAGRGVEFRQADLGAHDDPEEALFALVDRRTRLISISSIQFASGLRLNLERIGEFCRQRDIQFCVDAIQSLGCVDFDVEACQADFVMADGHKWMLGPEGLGVFYSRPEARDRLNLTQYGWHMIENTHNYENKPWQIPATAQRFECGSPNMLGIHALSASISLLLEIGMPEVEAKALGNAAYARELIERNGQLVLLSRAAPALQSAIVTFKHHSVENRSLFKHLNENNVICAMRGPGIRLSPHFYNDDEEIRRAIELASQLS